jgi:PAS domain S-box-containing protein
VSDSGINQADNSTQISGEPDVALQLQKISTLLIQEGNVDVLYEQVLDAAVELMSADFGSFQLYAPEQNELRLFAHRGFHPVSAAFWEFVSVGSTSTCGLAMSSGARTVVADVEAAECDIGTSDLTAYRKSGIRAVQSTPLMSRSGQLLGMISTHWRRPHQPPETAYRPLDVLARQAADLIERARIDAALRDSEERSRWLASIVETSNDAIISKDLEGTITSWIRGAERIFGYTAEEAIGKPVTILSPEDRLSEAPEILDRIRRGERVDHYETVRRRKDGSLIDISLTVSPLENANGRIVGATKIARDITERKRVHERQKLVVSEMKHRIKNSLATIQAIATQTFSQHAKERDAFIARLHALDRAHDLLTSETWERVSLRAAVIRALEPFQEQHRDRITIDGPDHLWLDSAKAVMVAMVVHELATNASKYGALSNGTGLLDVTWDWHTNPIS